MGITRYKYDIVTDVLYKTNLFNGTDADLDNTAPVDKADGFTKTIDLTSNMFANVTFEFLGSGSADSLSIKLYRHHDDNWSGNEIALTTETVTNDGSQDEFSFMIDTTRDKGGPGFYRFSMQSSAGNDTFDIIVRSRLSSLENRDE